MKSATNNPLKPGTLIVITDIYRSGYDDKAAICLDSMDPDCDISFDYLEPDDINGLLGEIIEHEDRSYSVAHIFALKARLILAVNEFKVVSERQDN